MHAYFLTHEQRQRRAVGEESVANPRSEGDARGLGQPRHAAQQSARRACTKSLIEGNKMKKNKSK